MHTKNLMNHNCSLICGNTSASRMPNMAYKKIPKQMERRIWPNDLL
ncbi:MAG: hypothetical protein V2I97_18265 [Desulfococcaceae bacterium]|nr:hypothetical protein [Desulfococcaceae bacterium]